MSSPKRRPSRTNRSINGAGVQNSGASDTRPCNRFLSPTNPPRSAASIGPPFQRGKPAPSTIATSMSDPDRAVPSSMVRAPSLVSASIERATISVGENVRGLRPFSRRLAKRTRDATQSRRLLALAEVYDGGSRTDASRIGGVGLQIIRDWVLRFNARGPDGLVDGKSPGAPSKLNADHRRALAEVVEAGPVPAVDGVVRWRRKDLARWLLETFAISLDETTVGRELKALGFAKISARPRHYAQNELAVEAFKKTSPPNWRRSGRGSRKASR